MRHWKIISWLIGALLLVGAVGLNTSSARTASQSQAMEPGTTLTLNCATRITFVRSTDRKTLTVTCAAQATPQPTKTTVAPTATAQPTSTQIPPTKTQVPATNTPVTPTATPTQQHQHPTATPVTPAATATPATRPTNTPAPGGLAPVEPEILGTCSAEVHDRYVVTGPNGKLYRTWHPQEVPVEANNPNGPKCRFAHEHGDDPTTSLANSSLPAFGYINEVANHPEEPHQGFKVIVANKGGQTRDGDRIYVSTRAVVHMGTGGPRRFAMQHHSLQFDLVADSGHFVHVMGIADTGDVMSICQRNAIPGGPPHGSRVVTLLPGQGCDEEARYEVWKYVLDIAGPDGNLIAQIHVSPALFDPITLMDANDKTRLVYTTDYWNDGPFYGCDRHAYMGPVYWYNANGAEEYRTDGFGRVTATGGLIQHISRHSTIGIVMQSKENQNLYSVNSIHCAPGLGVKN